MVSEFTEPIHSFIILKREQNSRRFLMSMYRFFVFHENISGSVIFFPLSMATYWKAKRLMETWQLNDRLNGILRQDFPKKKRARQRRWKSRGRNDIRVKRQYAWQFGRRFQKQFYDNMDRFPKNADRLSTEIASIGFWYQNPNPQPEGVWTISQGVPPYNPA